MFDLVYSESSVSLCEAVSGDQCVSRLCCDVLGMQACQIVRRLCQLNTVYPYHGCVSVCYNDDTAQHAQCHTQVGDTPVDKWGGTLRWGTHQ